MLLAPLFSRQCSTSGGRWMQLPCLIGVCPPPRWRTPSPSTTYTTSSYTWLCVGARPGGIMPTNCVTSAQPAPPPWPYGGVGGGPRPGGFIPPNGAPAAQPTPGPRGRRTPGPPPAVSTDWSAALTARRSPASWPACCGALTVTTTSSSGPGLSTSYASPATTKTPESGSSGWSRPSSDSVPRPDTTYRSSWLSPTGRGSDRPGAYPTTRC